MPALAPTTRRRSSVPGGMSPPSLSPTAPDTVNLSSVVGSRCSVPRRPDRRRRIARRFVIGRAVTLLLPQVSESKQYAYGESLMRVEQRVFKAAMAGSYRPRADIACLLVTAE